MIDSGKRIVTLDIIRGIAVMGILSVNIRMRLGEGAQLFYGTHAGPSSIGLNLVALACLIVLLVQRRTRSRRGTKKESKIEEKGAKAINCG